MPLTWKEIQANAVRFAKRWEEAAKEEAQAQSFTTGFLKVFGITDPERIGDFEFKVPLEEGKTGYFDYLWKKKIAIEMKSRGKNLKKAYEQLKEYVFHLPENEMPDLLMVCDFETIVLHKRTTGEKFTFKTRELRRHIRRFADIAGYETTRVYENEVEVNVLAAEKMARLHDALKERGYGGHELEVYLVRLLFSLFAEDTEIFPKDSFTNYVENSDAPSLAMRLGQLFDILNTPPEARKKCPELAAFYNFFPYINGGLFAHALHGAAFDAGMRETLLDCCHFDWKKISPAIFGAMFQGVMDPQKRRELGAHYTSEENILKLIKPLFMEDLWSEFESARASPAKLKSLHSKIASLKFLDPACGCGNFLIITYRELRRLELEILKMTVDPTQRRLDIGDLLKVNVGQFYGIEYEDFPCQIAQTGMWLIDHLMNLQVSEFFGDAYARLPLEDSAVIIHGNALALDWEKFIPLAELTYIFGNPPFSGARIMSGNQKNDLLKVFNGTKNAGNLDYVCCWHKKAVEMMEKNPAITAAFVATNSISQGDQVAILWKPFFEKGIHINFAYRTFRWNNEARGRAAVHCVIVGFGREERDKKYIFEGEEKYPAKNINGYLLDASDICLESRQHPLCHVPEIGIGNKPIDGGHYLFTEKEKDEFVASEPASEKYFKKWLGAEEFLHNVPRYCLWLGDCEPEELKKMPECLKRVEAVRAYRLDSVSAPTRKLAEFPRRFHVENMPDSEYIAIPKTSSENRRYIPIGFLQPAILAGDALFIIPRASLYHFGILASSAHNCWMRTVAGRLKSDYRYSKDIVYNNFPWPEADEKQRMKIAKLSQQVLDARAKFPDSSLAALYDPRTMPAELVKAHQVLDRAVVRLYGWAARISESEMVGKLFELYAELLTLVEGKRCF